MMLTVDKWVPRNAVGYESQHRLIIAETYRKCIVFLIV